MVHVDDYSLLFDQSTMMMLEKTIKMTKSSVLTQSYKGGQYAILRYVSDKIQERKIYKFFDNGDFCVTHN
jgi:hypothetical protein